MEEQDNSAAQTFLNETASVPDTLGTPVSDAAGQMPEAIEPSLVLTPSMMQQFVKFPFDMVANRIGKDGEFWRLQEEEAKALGEVWAPLAQWLLNKWGLSQHGPLIGAVFMTAASLAPRLALEKLRRESKTATTATASYGASPASSDPLGAVSHVRPTDSFPLPGVV